MLLGYSKAQDVALLDSTMSESEAPVAMPISAPIPMDEKATESNENEIDWSQIDESLLKELNMTKDDLETLK